MVFLSVLSSNTPNMSTENYPSKDVIYDFLDFLLLKKREKSYDSYISIKNAINNFSIPFPRITLKKGMKLFRGRVHNNNIEYYDKITDIGPQVDFNRITQFGRANEPLQSVFYSADNIYTAFFETSKIARGKSDIDTETMTMGVWVLAEDLQLAHIISNKQVQGLNVTLDGLQNNFEDLIQKFQNPKTELHLKVLDLFSLEFTRDAKEDPSNYMISCAFANYLFTSISYDTFYKKNM